MNARLLIRAEEPGDIAAIDAVTVAAFRHAPHADHTEQFIVRALRDAGQLTVSLVAEQGGAIVGHVAVSPVTVSDGAEGWFGLGPISVLPAMQGRGIGAALMHHALDALQVLGASGCVLLGDPAYYARFGFKPVPTLVLPGVPPEYFQAITFGSSFPSGEVAYHEAFEARA